MGYQKILEIKLKSLFAYLIGGHHVVWSGRLLLEEGTECPPHFSSYLSAPPPPPIKGTVSRDRGQDEPMEQ
jgi:hypothetical protein